MVAIGRKIREEMLKFPDNHFYIWDRICLYGTLFGDSQAKFNAIARCKILIAVPLKAQEYLKIRWAFLKSS